MNRKPVFYSNKHERKNAIKFSPKMPAKRPEPLIRPQLKGQASAHMNRRKADGKPIRLQSPLYSRQKVQFCQMNEGRHVLTEDQIKNSTLYKLLEDQIKQLAQRQTEELKKLKQIRDQKKKEVENTKKSQFQTKLQIWQLKTEVYELKDSIEQEKNQQQRLMQEINHLSANQHDHEFQSQGDDASQSEELSSDI